MKILDFRENLGFLLPRPLDFLINCLRFANPAEATRRLEAWKANNWHREAHSKNVFGELR